ncbi:hypothetical protein SAMN05216490_2630 [Mucilaginibacter mallensis]|uniref:DUF5703 domain-containing protein n=1 Tax=Mucilaginibacter mallensis TaxID=652787 RepID=A0A1H1Y4G3_MUCMA|nr:DUF5703 domain-containing protein [Mucilaginibacter mallensis]SDT16388.1 hypothetical protein SAMN05216490_2630 [Mucilaginibacter mallensis]
MKLRFLLLCILASLSFFKSDAQTEELSAYNLTWTSQSKNSGESMPCGGGDIGLNVWVENGELYFYVSKSGTFDENNTFLKLGRVTIKLFPNPFGGTDFSQQLHLQDGSVIIDGKNGNLSTQVKLWVDVYRPVVHVEINSSEPIKTEADYESWRYRDRNANGLENNQDSRKWSKDGVVKTLKDNITFKNNMVQFYHQNQDSTVFDATVHEQGMDAVKSGMFNPLAHLVFGGMLKADGMQAAGTNEGKYQNTDFEGWRLQSTKAKTTQNIEVYLNTSYVNSSQLWAQKLDSVVRDAASNRKTALQNTQNWWKQYWERSYIFINPDNTNPQSPEWQAGRNYQLFRYMLGCNAYGTYPTKFNGGLFTYDPVNVDTTYKFTPDFRNWGGGLMTAQNQRLVYWPMLKSGDLDMMKPQFDFYLRSLHNAELRSKVYWGHNGACFTEQIENFGLPNMGEYGLKRPTNFDKGVEYNAWLEYTWDTALEFCQMMLETEHYTGKDIKPYIPFIESCLTFFNEHYQYLAKKRDINIFDANGHLVLFPGSSGETYKMAYNSTSTIAALQTVLTTLLKLPPQYLTDAERKNWEIMLKRIPPINFTQIEGHKTIAPAKSWERINNIESMQLYPVFPWGIYGVGKPDLDVAINTWKYDTLAIEFRSGIGWKQDNIFAARMGLIKEAADLTVFKLKNSGRRFPAFWGPGFDWTPDHNWGGSGMIGLQEMLMQVDDKKIYLFPAWPKTWNVHFKLHAPYNTTVEATVKNGKVESLTVLPKEREKDIINML